MSKKRIAWVLSGWVLLQGAAAGFAGFGWLDSRPAERLPADFTCGALQLGDLQPDLAVGRILSEPALAGMPATVRLLLDGETFDIPAVAIGLRIEDEALMKLLRDNVPQSAWTRMMNSYSAPDSEDGKPIPLPLALDDAALKSVLKTIASEWDRVPVDAAARLDGDSFLIEPEVTGRNLEIDVMAAFLSEQMAAGTVLQDGVLTIDPGLFPPSWSKRNVPHATAAILETMVQVGTAEIPMAHGFGKDAAVAAETMGNHLLDPGSELDMLTWLEPANRDFSSEDSPSRAASAVHAAVLAVPGVSVLERHPAPYATDYAPPGQEAVIGGETGNLVIRNDLDTPLLLLTSENGETLRVSVFKEPSGVSATVFSDVFETTEPPTIFSMTRDLPPGETRVIAQGSAGLKVHVYRLDGTLKHLLHSDDYPPQNRILEMGMERSSGAVSSGK